MTFGNVVYVLCALTSAACAWLLAQAYRRSRTRLLLWSSCCFAGLFLNNVMLVLDLGVFPQRDLMIVRQVPALVGIGLMLYGLIWDKRS